MRHSGSHPMLSRVFNRLPANVLIGVLMTAPAFGQDRVKVEAGAEVYEMHCAACHGTDLMGVAGLPNMPAGAQLRLIGGRGTLASKNPVMTVESYWPYATTLFDYIRRAMPFAAPGSLTADETYALSAYVLTEAKIIDKSMVLDAKTLPLIEMPNRNGFIPDPRPEPDEATR